MAQQMPDKGSAGWSVAGLPVPWRDAAAGTVEAVAPLGEGSERTLAAGSISGFGTGTGRPSRSNPARKHAVRVHHMIKAVLAYATSANLDGLYRDLLATPAAQYVDDLVEHLSRDPQIDQARLRELATWLIDHAPDAEPVAIGKAMLERVGNRKLFQPARDLGDWDTITPAR